jgi:hypothetical protein
MDSVRPFSPVFLHGLRQWRNMFSIKERALYVILANQKCCIITDFHFKHQKFLLHNGLISSLQDTSTISDAIPIGYENALLPFLLLLSGMLASFIFVACEKLLMKTHHHKKYDNLMRASRKKDVGNEKNLAGNRNGRLHGFCEWCGRGSGSKS